MRVVQKSKTRGLIATAVMLVLSLSAMGLVSAADNGHLDGDKGPGSSLWPGDRSSTRHPEQRRLPVRPGRHRMWRALKQLDLTDAQKTAIHEIRVSLKKDMIRKRADLKIAKMELHDQLTKERVDMNAVEAHVKEVESLRTAMTLNAIKARVKIKDALTPDQRKKLAELMRNSRRDNTQRHGRG
jgi:Spy/CpxP family protein refolding chaperone